MRGSRSPRCNDALNFGFSADDTGNYLLEVLMRYDRSFEPIDFLSGDSLTVNGVEA